MANVRRFDSDISFNCIYVDNGNLVRADEHLTAIAEANATIERLRAALAEEQARTVCAACGRELAEMAKVTP